MFAISRPISRSEHEHVGERRLIDNKKNSSIHRTLTASLTKTLTTSSIYVIDKDIYSIKRITYFIYSPQHYGRLCDISKSAICHW